MTNRDGVHRFSSVLERLIATLEAENGALNARRPYHVAELNARKTMALYELDRLGRAGLPKIAEPTARLERVRLLLEENRKLLGVNIRALGDLIEMLHKHQLGDEADGTYSAYSLVGLKR